MKNIAFLASLLFLISCNTGKKSPKRKSALSNWDQMDYPQN